MEQVYLGIFEIGVVHMFHLWSLMGTSLHNRIIVWENTFPNMPHAYRVWKPKATLCYWNNIIFAGSERVSCVYRLWSLVVNTMLNSNSLVAPVNWVLPLHLDSLMVTSSNWNFSALLVLCVGNSPVIGEFPAQRPVTQSFGVFSDPRLNKRLIK